MAIENVQIATNRYAPQGSDAINLYNRDGAEGLTIGQTVMSVCLQAAAASENQSVVKMNIITGGSDVLATAADWMESILSGSADWSQARTFITGTLGVASSSLPDGIDTYEKRMQVVSAMKSKMDLLAQQQQQDMIDLQTAVNRRDVAFATSSNTVRALGTSMSGNAANF